VHPHDEGTNPSAKLAPEAGVAASALEQLPSPITGPAAEPRAYQFLASPKRHSSKHKPHTNNPGGAIHQFFLRKALISTRSNFVADGEYSNLSLIYSELPYLHLPAGLRPTEISSDCPTRLQLLASLRPSNDEYLFLPLIIKQFGSRSPHL
jgi:hypothetical protein